MAEQTEYEDVFMRAVIRACEQDYCELLREIQGYTHTFSTEFNEDMAVLLRQNGNFTAAQDTKQKQQNSSSRKRARILRILLVAAVLIALSTMAVMANDELREKIGNLIVRVLDHDVEVEQEDVGEPKEEFEHYLLTYIPNGYEKVDEMDNDPVGFSERYENAEGQYILYDQYDIAAGNESITYEDGCLREQININGIEAELVSDGEINSLFFEWERYLFTIQAYEEKDELIKMAESLILS